MKYTSDLQPGDSAILAVPERFLDDKKAIVGLGFTKYTSPFQKGNSKRLFVIDVPQKIYEFMKRCHEQEKTKSARKIYPNLKTRCGCSGAYLRPGIQVTVIKQLQKSVLTKFVEPVVLYVNYGEPWLDFTSDHIPSYTIYWKSFEEVFGGE